MRGILLEKAYGASVMIGAAVLLVSLRFDSFAISAGVVTGTALAMAVLASWQWIARRALTPDSPSRNLALALGMLKLPLLGAVVYVLVGREWVDPVAFAVGVAVPQAAVVVLAVGARSKQQQEAAAPGAVEKA